MEYLSIAIGVVILYLVHKVILTPMRHLVVNVIIGLIVLYGVNHLVFSTFRLRWQQALLWVCLACPASCWLRCITRFFNVCEEGIS